MTIYYENDVVSLKQTIDAKIVGDNRSLMIPAGTIGTIVLVYGAIQKPEAYEVEFYIQDYDSYALATIKSEQIVDGNPPIKK